MAVGNLPTLQLPALPGRAPQRRRRRPLPPSITEEERRNILGRALGGLAYIGGAIDKPFAATRGTVAAIGSALSGKPRKAKEDIKQLLHLIPFSGTFREQFTEMGIPVPEEHIWGREVLERFGAPRNKPTGISGWKRDPAEAFWDVAGIATDLFLAPPFLPGLLPVTAKGAKIGRLGQKALKEIDEFAQLGKTEQALTKATQLAKPSIGLKAGEEGLKELQKLPSRLLGTTPAAKIAEVEAGERALLGLRPTWGVWSTLLGKHPIATFGTGKTAARALDAVYYKSGLIPALRSHFGATTLGKRGGTAQRAIEQEIAVEIHRAGALKGLLPHLAAEHDELAKIYAQHLQKYAEVAGDTRGVTQFRDFSRYVTEVQSRINGAARMTEQEISALFHIPTNNLKLLDEVNEFSRRLHNLATNSMADVRDELFRRILAYGGDGAVMRAAFVAHMPRRRVGALTVAQEEGLRGARRFDYSLKRLQSFDVPEGTYLINRLVGEGIWSQPADAALSKVIRGSKKNFGGFHQEQIVRLKSTSGLKETFDGIGRIVAFEGDNAVVSRLNPNGFMDQIRVPISALDDATQGSAGALVPPPLYTKEAQRAAYETILRDKGIAFTAKDSDTVLRRKALYHGHLKPAFDRELHRGMKIPVEDTTRPRWIKKGATDNENLARALERLEKGIDPIRETIDGKSIQVAEGANSVTDDLASWLYGGPALPDGLFNRTIVEDHITYVTHGLDYLHGLMVKHNFLHGVATTTQKPGFVPLEEAWASVTTRFGRQAKTARALTDDGLDTFARDFGAARSDIYVPAGTAKTLQIFQDIAEPGSKVHSMAGQMFDIWTAGIKAGWTLSWPAFHVRNFAAGQFQNLAADGPYTISQYGNQLKQVSRWIHSGGKQPWKYASEVGPAELLQKTLVTELKGSTEDLGAAGGGLRWIFGAPKTWNPARIRGIPRALGMQPIARSEAQFVPMAIGERAYSYVESMNRLPLYGACRDAGMTMEQAAQFVKRVQYDYSAKAFTPFERDIMRRFVFPFYCVPEDHEILTRDGWKRWPELIAGEDVLVLDPETHELRWEPLQDVATFDYDGELWTLERRTGGFEFTPDHRWPTETTKSVVKGKQYGGERRMKRACELNTCDRIPLVGNYQETDSVLSPRHAAILGWVVTDGYFRWRTTGGAVSEPGTGSCEMLVYQSPKKHLALVAALLGTRQRPPHSDTGVCAVPVSREDTEAITSVFQSREDLLKIVPRLSREAAEAMYEAMVLAEAHESDEHHFTRFAQSGPNGRPVLEAFQLLCLLTDKNAWLNSKKNGCYVKRSRTIRHHERGGIGRKHYKGVVWCPQTPSGTWIMRHDGAVIPTGNSWLKHNAIYHASEIFGNPGGKVSTAIRMAATANRFGTKLPRWLSEQGAIPVGGSPEATTVIRQFGFPFEDIRNIQATPGRTAQRAVSQMHPGIAIPMKLFSGKDPYTGRDLKQMSGMTGIWQIDTLFQGLPTSRAYSTYRTATDKRKSALVIALDLLTGMKLGTYDLEKARITDLQRAIQEEMEQNPYVWEGRHQYIPKHLKAKAGPEVPQKLRQIQALSKELEALKAARKLKAFPTS